MSDTLASAGTRLVDIIWNVTRLCPWDCSICCVDAIHARKVPRSTKVEVRSHALSHREELPVSSGRAPFDSASAHLQARGVELDLARKLKVIDHLEGTRARLDISGGDPLVLAENWLVLRHASRTLGRKNITLTATGRGLRPQMIDELAQWIGEFNFTYDPTPTGGTRAGADRPKGYADANLTVAERLAKQGVLTRAEVPLTKHNCSPGNLRQIYAALAEAGIGRLLIMRLFPVGRATKHLDAVPTRAQYLSAIRVLKDLARAQGATTVSLQCALRHIEAPDRKSDTNPCDLLAESFGLMPDGTLLLSPWAIGPHGMPFGPEWVLGNLADTPLIDLLGTERAAALLRRLDENFGHCKVFAYLHAAHQDPTERLLAPADPLYSNAQVREHAGSNRT